MPSRLALLAGDIRIWILFFALVRLIGITDPPADKAHNWRQATVLMVARNYHEQGIDLLHPRIDFAGEKSGITGMEFPLLNAGVAAVAAVCGWHDWHGRVLVLLCYMLGVWAYHQLIHRWLGPRAAFIATLLLMSSLWFQYGRKTMPDVPALALVITGVYALQQLLTVGGWWRGLLGWSCIACGVLMKSPAVLLLVGLLPVLWPYRAERRGVLVGLLVLSALLPALWWYGSWVPHLERTYGFAHFFMGKHMALGAQELWARSPEVAEKFYFDALRFTGCAAFLAGVVLAVRRRAGALLEVTAVGFLGFAGLMLLAGGTFAEHSYYILPIVPFMAAVAAFGLAQLPGSWGYVLAAVVAVEGVANAQHDLFMPASQRTFTALEPLLDEVAPRGERIVINAGEVPTAMYFAHRTGWLATNAALQQPAFRDSLAALGARTVVVLRQREEGDVQLPLEERAVTADYRVYRLP